MSEEIEEVTEAECVDLNKPIHPIVSASPLSSENLVPTLDELFDKNPLLHSPEERAALLSAMSEARERWFLEEEKANRLGKKASLKKGTPSAKSLVKIDDATIEALDIKL